MKYFADSALTAEDLYRRSMWWAAWMVRCYKMLAHELLGKTMFWDLCVKNCHLSSHWMTCLSLILCVALHSLPVGGKVWHLQVQTRVRQQFHLWIWPGGWKRMPWLLRGWCCFISLCTFFPAACFEDCQIIHSCHPFFPLARKRVESGGVVSRLRDRIVSKP